MPAGADVLTAEYKINLLSPAVGEYFVAEGRVLKAGRTLSVVRADVFAVVEDGRKLVATMLASVVAVPQKN
jgi:acyl-coenzyme A thioesterase PaaI-like protein